MMRGEVEEHNAARERSRRVRRPAMGWEGGNGRLLLGEALLGGLGRGGRVEIGVGQDRSLWAASSCPTCELDELG